MENKEFDKKIASHLSQRKLEINAEVWEQIEAQLPQPNPSRFGLVKWAAALVLLMGLAVVFQWNKTKMPVVNTEPKPILQSDPTNDLQLVTAPIEKVEKVEKLGNTKTPPKVAEKKPLPIAERTPISPKDQLTVVQPFVQKENSVAETNLPKTNVNSISSEKPPEVPVMSLTENVMRRLKTNKANIQVDSHELLSQSERELYEDNYKNTREKIIEKLKTTYQELTLASKN